MRGCRELRDHKTGTPAPAVDASRIGAHGDLDYPDVSTGQFEP